MRVFDQIFNDNTTDAWISGLGSFAGALLAGFVTGGIAIWITKKQMKDHDKKLSTNYEKGQQLIENFVEHAIVNLNAMLDGPRRGAPPDKERLVSEFKKFQHVNAALAAIPNEQIDIRFNFEFQNIRIILRTLEYEIERVIKKLYVELEIANVNEAFHRIEIDKRILFILDHIMKFSNHPELQRIRNELHKSTAEERDPIA